MLSRITGDHRHVGDDRPRDVQTKQHIGFEKVPATDLAKREAREGRAVNGREPVRWIKDIPISRRQLRQKRKSKVPDQSLERHLLCIFGAEEAISFHVIRQTGPYRLNQRRHELRIHLPIAVNLDNNVAPVRKSRLIPRDDGSADARVAVVEQNKQPLIGAIGLNEFACFLRACIIDRDDSSDLRAYARDHIENTFPAFVARKNNRHPQSRLPLIAGTLI